jgi:hypothetical protein
MAAIASNALVESYESQPLQLTLLELVKAVGEVTNDEAEIVATVTYMLRSGRVSLAGCFRDEGLERFFDD